MTVISPADANETRSAVKAMTEMEGPCYIRLNRNDYENVTEEGAEFKIGVPTVLKEGTQVVVFATGYMAGLAMQAAKELEGQISVRVVNVSTIKPINTDAVIRLARGLRGVVTAEEHSVVGGLGSAIAEALKKECIPIEFVGIEDTFGCSAHNYQDLLEYHGLTKKHIMEVIEGLAQQDV